jgi:hypothetical protein
MGIESIVPFSRYDYVLRIVLGVAREAANGCFVETLARAPVAMAGMIWLLRDMGLLSFMLPCVGRAQGAKGSLGLPRPSSRRQAPVGGRLVRVRSEVRVQSTPFRGWLCARAGRGHVVSARSVFTETWNRWSGKGGDGR